MSERVESWSDDELVENLPLSATVKRRLLSGEFRTVGSIRYATDDDLIRECYLFGRSSLKAVRRLLGPSLVSKQDLRTDGSGYSIAGARRASYAMARGLYSAAQKAGATMEAIYGEITIWRMWDGRRLLARWGKVIAELKDELPPEAGV